MRKLRVRRVAEVVLAAVVVSAYGLPVVAACGLPLALAPAVGYVMLVVMN